MNCLFENSTLQIGQWTPSRQWTPSLLISARSNASFVSTCVFNKGPEAFTASTEAYAVAADYHHHLIPQTS